MKARQVFVGSFYGYNLNIEVPKEMKDLPDHWFVEKFEEYRVSERRSAIEQYKDELFMKQLEAKRKLEESKESFFFKLYQKIMK